MRIFDTMILSTTPSRNEIPVAILALGYPAEDCKPSDRHPVRKEIDCFTKWL